MHCRAKTDDLDDEVHAVVREQVEYFKRQPGGVPVAYCALFGVYPVGRMTWNDIEIQVEKQYRELNNLTTRKDFNK